MFRFSVPSYRKTGAKFLANPIIQNSKGTKQHREEVKAPPAHLPWPEMPSEICFLCFFAEQHLDRNPSKPLAGPTDLPGTTCQKALDRCTAVTFNPYTNCCCVCINCSVLNWSKPRHRQVKSLTHTAHSGFGLRDSDGIDEESEAQRGRVTSPR